jgi:hypothetical protein
MQGAPVARFTPLGGPTGARCIGQRISSRGVTGHPALPRDACDAVDRTGRQQEPFVGLGDGPGRGIGWLLVLRIVLRCSCRMRTREVTVGYRARAWRIVHAAWSVAQLTALATIYGAVARGRRSPRVWVSAGFLVLEGGGLLIGRGDCPMGRIQEQWGDPKPFFELVLPPRAAKAAVPVLAVIAGAALLALVVRSPGLRWRA